MTSACDWKIVFKASLDNALLFWDSAHVSRLERIFVATAVALVPKTCNRFGNARRLSHCFPLRWNPVALMAYRAWGCSCKFLPTVVIFRTVEIPSDDRCAGSPTPDRCNIAGVLIAPAAMITSFRTFARYAVDESVVRTNSTLATVFDPSAFHTSLDTLELMSVSQLGREFSTGERYAVADDERRKLSSGLIDYTSLRYTREKPKMTYAGDKCHTVGISTIQIGTMRDASQIVDGSDECWVLRAVDHRLRESSVYWTLKTVIAGNSTGA